MSVDLNFWKYKQGISLNHQDVYQAACCNGEIIKGLRELPIADIIARIKEVFSHWNYQQENTFESDGTGAFEIFTTSQIIRFDCYGMDANDMNRLIDIMLKFGCPLYDPQINTRFDEAYS